MQASNLDFDTKANTVSELPIIQELFGITVSGDDSTYRPLAEFLEAVFCKRPVQSLGLDGAEAVASVQAYGSIAKEVSGGIQVLAVYGGVMLLDASANVAEVIVQDMEATFQRQTPTAIKEALKGLRDAAVATLLPMANCPVGAAAAQHNLKRQVANANAILS